MTSAMDQWQDDVDLALMAFGMDARYAVAMANRARIILARRTPENRQRSARVFQEYRAKAKADRGV